MTSNAKCMKTVPYQDILNVMSTAEQLQSWQEPLKVLEEFFSNNTTPLNKKRIVRDYHSSSKLFHLFLTDYEELINQLETQVHTLKIQNKLRTD